jgi:hypothetical protein
MKKVVIFLMVVLTISLYSQTSGTGSRIGGSRTGGSRTGGSRTGGIRSGGSAQQQMMGGIMDMLASIIGGKMRHPDPEIRKQALMSFVSSLSADAGGQGRGTRGQGGATGLFSLGGAGGRGGGRGGTQGETGGGLYLTDLFDLIHDPDPEIADLAQVGLDMIFNTEVILLRFMNDEDPLIRKYATRIYIMRNFMQTGYGGRGGAGQYGDSFQLLALRTLLVKLKHEKDPGVRKLITDCIEQVLMGTGYGYGRGGAGGMLIGVDTSILEYLNDPNPDVRKSALIVIAQMEYNPSILNLLFERLKVEEDEEIKEMLQLAIETISGSFATMGTQRGRTQQPFQQLQRQQQQRTPTYQYPQQRTPTYQYPQQRTPTYPTSSGTTRGGSRPQPDDEYQ